MKVSAINSRVNFCRALKPEEMQEFNAVRDEAKQLAGQTGKSILIVHDACLPQTSGFNTGVSNLSFKDSQEFFAYMKPYLGINMVEFLPQGQVGPYKTLYCAYTASALSLGNPQINPELLTKSEFYNLLTPKEFQSIVQANTSADKETLVNYKNVMDNGSPQDKALRKAYERFKNLDENNPLRKDFVKFTKENDDWLEPKGIYQAIANKFGVDFRKWTNEVDVNLYNPDFDAQAREQRIKQIVSESSDDIEFFKFKQFLADKHLAIGREKLNAMGLKLIGDCEIGFSYDERWAYPKAFMKDCNIGDSSWHLPALNYDTITDPQSDSAKLLKRKVQLCAKRYDSIRFDVGWAYVNPRLFKSDGTVYTRYMGEDVLRFIEDAVREVKGQDYDLHNLMYEFEGGDIFKPNSSELLDPVKKRVKIFGTTFMHEYPHDVWGSNDAFLKRGWSPDEFVVGIGNHDPQPLRQIAYNIPDNAMPEGNNLHKFDAIKPLARILGLDENNLRDPVEFAKAKWAEPMMAKNNQMFYMDVFGREERFDMQCDNVTVHPHKNYAYKIPADYKGAYHSAVEEGFGFNIMDSLEKVFKAKGLDKSHPELYAKIVKFRNILYEKTLSDAVEASRSESVIENSVSKNKVLKPVLICTALAVGFLGAMKFMHNKKSKEN